MRSSSFHLIAVVLGTFALASTAMAQSQDGRCKSVEQQGCSSKFISIDAYIMEGAVKIPAVLAVTGRDKVKWDRLFSLKKSLKNELVASHTDAALK